MDRVRTHFDPVAGAELWDPAKKMWHDILGAPSKRAYAQLIATDHAIYRLSGVGEDERPYDTIEELVWR
jgi:hypothetical protein